jgi:hypothetical protein|tara:strand:- start:984 stop:1715 length:732 start_codon:yes stop_codon:yes gene_type:complete
MIFLNDSEGWGRLCNQIFRSIGISILAKKHNLKVQYPFKYIDIMNKLGIILFNGSKTHNNITNINDNNLIHYINLENIDYTFNIEYCFFQTLEISDLIYNYIRNECKENIIIHNKFKDRYNNNNDVFIHMRLGDTIYYRIHIHYYINILNTLNYNNIYISSDTINDTDIMKIQQTFKNVYLIEYNEIDTIHFGSTCKNVILSTGSFSAIIGYMAFYSNIFYNNNTSNWCPLNIFENKGFIPKL